jgi:hypothetical protein
MLAPFRGKHANRGTARLAPRPRVSSNSTTKRVESRLQAGAATRGKAHAFRYSRWRGPIGRVCPACTTSGQACQRWDGAVITQAA